ncbi:MAG: type IV pilus modification protein PilV [Pseudomonadota bacterium]|nr:type IV pilus modification protein PilV [Pseudomonadota bacterium]
MKVLSRQRGVSLIEVLVAILVFSIGVLGLALMQVKGAQFTKEAGARSNVIIQVRSLIDAMRANPVAAKGPVKAADPSALSASDCPYCFDGNATLANCVSSCTPATSANSDLYNWVERLKKAAPGSMGTSPKATVTWDPVIGMYAVTATWSGGAMDGGAATASDNVSYTLNYLP